LLQRNGEQIQLVFTSSDGMASIAGMGDVQDGLLIIKKDGYSNLVAKYPCDGMTYALSPVLTDLDAMRVVLTWGPTPSDLDSHMLFKDNHIYFNNSRGTNAELDVDDIDSYGPETITLKKKMWGEKYIYAVRDFSNRDKLSSSILSASRAKVFVYVGQSLVRSYEVPMHKVGNLWTVFRITEDGAIQGINTISDIYGDEGEAESENEELVSKLNQIRLHGVTGTAQDIHPDVARSYNLRGEAAYADRQYGEAITLFQLAIDADPDYGKAYGNLGLTCQKAGRTAEAIWANRKAIALASGNHANTIRAGAYYNIARIYEAAGQREEALHYYRLAKGEKNNSVFDNAIKRLGTQ
jgi:hypothetical protein